MSDVVLACLVETLLLTSARLVLDWLLPALVREGVLKVKTVIVGIAYW